MSATTRRTGLAGNEAGPAIASRHQEAQIVVEHTEPDRPPIPYGVDHPDTDLWADRDGRVYRGDGPYLNRPLRWLR